MASQSGTVKVRHGIRTNVLRIPSLYALRAPLGHIPSGLIPVLVLFQSFNMEEGQGCAFVTFRTETEARKFLSTWDR